MNRILLNKQYMSKCFTAALSVEFTILSTILLFFSIEEDFKIPLDSFCKKCFFIIIPIILALLFAIFKTCTFRKNKIVDETQRSIVLRYGNLWNYAFPKFDHKERIVVINVNTAFDVIIESPEILNPLVSASTIHGQWINHMNHHGISAAELNKEIQKSLDNSNITPLSTTSKVKGNPNNYPKGTIVPYKYNNTIFYLLALSEFDKENHAQNTQEELRETIIKLIKFIGDNSQGVDVYIPVMGAGQSRTGISDQIALELLSSTLKINCDKLHGNINVVVYEGNRDKVTIKG